MKKNPLPPRIIKILLIVSINIFLLTSFSLFYATTGCAQQKNPSFLQQPATDAAGDDSSFDGVQEDIPIEPDEPTLAPSLNGITPDAYIPPTHVDANDPPEYTPPDTPPPEDDIRTHVPVPQPSTHVLIPSKTIQQPIRITTITVTTAATQPHVTITQTHERPDAIPAPTLRSEQTKITEYYLLLLTDNTGLQTPSDVSSMTVTFAIDKTWLQENNIDGQSLQIIHYENTLQKIWRPSLVTPYSTPSNPDDWQEIIPTQIREDDAAFYYEVKIHDCQATIAFIDVENIDMQPYTSELIEIPWTALIGLIIVASLLLIVFLFKAGYISYEDDQTTGESRYVLSYKKRRTTRTVRQHYQHLRHFTKKPVPHSKIYNTAATLKIFLHFFIAIIW